MVRALRRRDAVAGGAVQGAGPEGHRRAAAVIGPRRGGCRPSALPVLLDPKGALARAFNARGIPTTVIINTGGKVVARLEGAADWSAPEAQALIQKLVATG
jgi:hypothetical protein